MTLLLQGVTSKTKAKETKLRLLRVPVEMVAADRENLIDEHLQDPEDLEMPDLVCREEPSEQELDRWKNQSRDFLWGPRQSNALPYTPPTETGMNLRNHTFFELSR